MFIFLFYITLIHTFIIRGKGGRLIIGHTHREDSSLHINYHHDTSYCPDNTSIHCVDTIDCSSIRFRNLKFIPTIPLHYYSSLYSTGKMIEYDRCSILGITSTIGELLSSDTIRMDGIIRFLYEDFHVNEIDLNGNILKLNKYIDRNIIKNGVNNIKKLECGVYYLLQFNNNLKNPTNLLTDDDYNNLNILLQSLKSLLYNHDIKIPICHLKLIDNNKINRTLLHEFIKQQLSFLDSKTIQIDGGSGDKNSTVIAITPKKICLKSIKEYRISYKSNSISENTSNIDNDHIDSYHHLAPEVTTSVPLGIPPEVTTSVPLGVEPSSNYLSLKGDATPGDRGGGEGSEDVTSSGKPLADLREAEGEVIRRAVCKTTSGETPSGTEVDSTSVGTSGHQVEKFGNPSIKGNIGVHTLSDMINYVDITDYNDFPSDHKEIMRRKKYLHFNLTKVNRDTSEIVNSLCKVLKRGSFDFFTAGNKDKRAITTQRICIRRCNIKDIFTAMALNDWPSDIYLSDFQYSEKRLHLGDLNGNHFQIAIRGLNDANKIIKNIKHLQQYGFINYFGLQRFGTHIIGTHIIGASIIKHQYHNTVKLILGDVNEAKNIPIFNEMKPKENDDAPPDVQSTSLPLAVEASSNYLSLKGGATPRDRGEGDEEEQKVLTRKNVDNQPLRTGILPGGTNNVIPEEQTSSGSRIPESDLRELEGDVNREGHHGEWKTSGGTPNGITSCGDSMDAKENIDDCSLLTVLDGNEVDIDVTYDRKYRYATEYYLRDGDVENALKYLPRHFFIERSILKGIKQGLSFEKCLEKIPKNILSIYVHATQSVLFNLAATHRLTKYGLKPIIGDLVIKQPQSINPRKCTRTSSTSNILSNINSPPEVQSNSPSTRRGASPPEVTTTVPLGVEPSSYYLSLKSSATPGDRGDVNPEEQKFYPEEQTSIVVDVTSSGLPAADLREAEGEVNRRGHHGEWEDRDRTSGGTGVCSDITSSRVVSNMDDSLLFKHRLEVIELTCERELEDYGIEDVVLPLPGDNVIYPSYMIEYYEKISMDKFNIPLSMFTSKIGDMVSISGSYRNIVVRPTDVQYEIIYKLDDPYMKLIKSISDNKIINFKRGNEVIYKDALIIKCSLPRSSYITIALRELLNNKSLE